MTTTRIDLSGRRFGLLLVSNFSHSANSVYWHCACDCGTKLVRRGGDLLKRERSGQNQSCGCVRSRVSGDGLLRCGKCREFKSADCFRKDSGTRSGVNGHCKSCQDAWRSENSELLCALSQQWRKINPERVKKVAAAYRKNNLHRQAANEARRRAAKLRATPAWADLEKIRTIYEDAQKQGMEVDHVVPLRGRTVCGLHVENNLQLLTKKENGSKNNRFWPDSFAGAVA